MLHLQGNKLTHLRQCEKNLPETIEVLTLHNNLICDLNEVSHLVNFNLLRELSFANNPCISFAEEKKYPSINIQHHSLQILLINISI